MILIAPYADLGAVKIGFGREGQFLNVQHLHKKVDSLLCNLERVCTSHVERSNLTMRMQMRRLTRLTNGFSKKWDNLKAALALYFAWHNFCRVHQTLRVTPAMDAELTNHIWSLSELIAA